MKNCFEGYLTSECKNCEFWKDGTTNEGIECACTFHISHCEAFSKENEVKEENKITSRYGDKGIISKITSDHVEKLAPIDIIYNPLENIRILLPKKYEPQKSESNDE